MPGWKELYDWMQIRGSCENNEQYVFDRRNIKALSN